MKQQKFKFYTQKGRYLNFVGERQNLTWKTALKTLPKFIWAIVVGVCFRFGSAVYGFFSRSLAFIQKQLAATAAAARQRLALIKNGHLGKTLATFLVIALLSYGGLAAFHLLAKGLELKNRLVNVALLGSQDLADAKNALQDQNFSEAGAKFQQAYQAFATGQKQLADENRGLNDLLNLLPQKQDSDKLFAAAALLSGAGENFTKACQNFGSLSITAVGLSGNGQNNPDLAASKTLIDTALAQINQAGNLVQSVNSNLLPGAYREKLAALQQNYVIIQRAFEDLRDTVNLAFGLLNGDKRVLLLMENNNELRPTGGFMGTFGDAHIVNGNLLSLNVSSIYDLDGQLSQKIQPPFPIYAVNDRWFLRDANWFADFPSTAQKITHFYEQEGGQTPDEIVALTPTVLQNLLALTGPIQLPRYGVTLTPDNFIETIQIQSSIYYNGSDNKPKQILADLFPVLLTRLGSLPKEQFPQLLQIIQDSFNQKQLVLYARDNPTETQIKAYNWGGGILDADRDYLNIISANLNGSKTDLYLKQSLNLKTSIAKDGQLTDQLIITRTNTMPDLPGTANASFIRIMVPQGSTLVSNAGFDYNTGTPPDTAGYQTDPDVAVWEQSIVKDFVSGTSIGREAGKTFFGNWLTVKGGQTKTVTLTYRLPFKLASLDHFSLLAQKQIGALPADFSYSLDFPARHLLWQNFSPDNLQADHFTYNFSLDKDTLLGEVFGGY